MRNFSINPSSLQATAFAERYKPATTAVFLGKKTGGSFSTFTPSVLLADTPSAPLIHLKERNAILPVLPVIDPIAGADITLYTDELTTAGYDVSISGGLGTKLGLAPAYAYLDLLRGEVFSHPDELKMPTLSDPARSYRYTSGLYQRLARRARSLVNRGLSVRATGSTTTACTAAKTGNPFMTSITSVWDALISTDERTIDVASGDQIVAIPGVVLVEVEFIDSSNPASEVVTNERKYVFTTVTAANGYTMEKIFVKVRSHTVAAKLTSQLILSHDSTQSLYIGWSQVQATTGGTVNYVASGVNAFNVFSPSSGSEGHYYGVEMAAGEWNAGHINTYGTVLTATEINTINVWKQVLPYPDGLQKELNRWLLLRGGQTIDGTRAEDDYRELVRYLQSTSRGNPLITVGQGGMARVDAGVNLVPVSADGFCMQLGYVFSAGKPSGKAMSIESIHFDTVLDSDSTGEVPIFLLGRDVVNDPYTTTPILSFEQATGAELETRLNALSGTPGFPASLDAPTIASINQMGFGVFMVDKLAITDVGFLKSSFNGVSIDGNALDGSTMMVGEDTEGGLVSYDDAVIALETNGFFSTTRYTMIYIPLRAAITSAIVTTIEVAVTGEGTVIDGTMGMTMTEAVTHLIADDGFVKLTAVAGITAGIADGTIPNPSDFTTSEMAESLFRTFYSLPPFSLDASNSLDVTSLDPSTYFSLAPLESATTEARVRPVIPEVGSLSDLCVLQKDISKGGRKVLTALLQPVPGFIDPL